MWTILGRCKKKITEQDMILHGVCNSWHRGAGRGRISLVISVQLSTEYRGNIFSQQIHTEGKLHHAHPQNAKIKPVKKSE